MIVARVSTFTRAQPAAGTVYCNADDMCVLVAVRMKRKTETHS
jgi:hypothetical protein